MMGIDQAGIGEVLQQTLSAQPAPLRHQLAQVRPAVGPTRPPTQSKLTATARPRRALGRVSPPHQNVFVTGGAALLRGYTARIEREVRQQQPADLPVRIWSAQDVQLDAWRGAARWTGAPTFAASCLTRAAYEEHGHDYLVEHLLSNWYHPTPAALAPSEDAVAAAASP